MIISVAAYEKIEKNHFKNAWKKSRRTMKNQGCLTCFSQTWVPWLRRMKQGDTILLTAAKTDNLLYGIIEEGKTAYIKIRF